MKGADEMDDRSIIALYWERDESAIAKTAEKYGKYLYTVSKNIVSVHEDAEECVQDTYKSTWDTIPPNKPDIFKAFLTKLTRRISISRVRYLSADKRSGYNMVFDELENSLADFSLDEHIEKAEISRVLNAFVGSLRQNDREVFVLRYFYFESVRDIANRFGASENKIKSQLFRLRKKLAENLKKEGIFYEN